MKIKTKRVPLAAVVTAMLFVFTVCPVAVPAQQNNWSPWQPCGNSVPVSFVQVAGLTTWTWKFRNDGAQTITYMDFYYTDNTGKYTDVLPGSLKPGAVIGGWTAFTANSAPTIQIKSIQWANSPAPAAGGDGQSLQPQNNGLPPQTQLQPNAGPTAQQPALPPRQLAAADQHLANAQADQAAAQSIAAAGADGAAALADTDTDGDTASAFRTDLAPYGRWMDLDGQTYWQPAEAGLGSAWRPYADGGHWVLTDAGWTWDSQYDWGWAAFHYGRWVDDPLLGWLWAPGRQWGPAWVVWRGNDTLCGWAPLPPGSIYQVGFGFWFNGVWVSVDCDFGLGPDAYCFISISDICQPSYRTCLVPAVRAAEVYKKTAIVKTAYMAHGGKVINAGIGVDKVRVLTHRDIKPLKIADAPSSREKGTQGETLAMYRPRVPASSAARPAEKLTSAAEVMKDLLAPASPARKPAPARAARASDVMDEILPPANARQAVTQKTPNSASGVMNELFGGGPAPRKPVPETAHGSEDVPFGKLLAGGQGVAKAGPAVSHPTDGLSVLLGPGHDVPPPRTGPVSRPVEQTGRGSGTMASQTGYGGTAQTYQPGQPARPPIPGQAYQPPQTAQQPTPSPSRQGWQQPRQGLHVQEPPAREPESRPYRAQGPPEREPEHHQEVEKQPEHPQPEHPQPKKK